MAPEYGDHGPFANEPPVEWDTPVHAAFVAAMLRTRWHAPLPPVEMASQTPSEASMRRAPRGSSVTCRTAGSGRTRSPALKSPMDLREKQNIRARTSIYDESTDDSGIYKDLTGERP